MVVGDVAEERRERRRVGDPRISREGRAILARLTDGDVADNECRRGVDAWDDSTVGHVPALRGHTPNPRGG